MEVQITSRRGTVGSAFRRAAETRARGLEKYEPRLRRIELLFDEDGGRVAAEARASVPGIPARVARADGVSHRSALDRVMRKVGRQLRDERSRRVDHRAPPLAEMGSEAE